VRRLILMTAAVLVAVVLFLVAMLPPKAVRLPLHDADPDLARRTIAGAYHVHTTRSDGADGTSAVAAAAARAGLKFVILADHGDATREPDPPVYIDGVLCIDAVEISTRSGHYVALGLPASPYPLGGEASAVVEDVTRLGGFGIVAHPDHPRPELAWSDWDAPFDGLEWINADSEWRNESTMALARVVSGYLLRPAPAVASVFDRPDRTLTRWDTLNRSRPVVALAAVDAHGGGGRSGSAADYEPRVAVGPSYEVSFRTVSNRVVLARPPGGDAREDARLLLEAIAGGAVYSVIDAISPDVLVALDPGDLGARSPLMAGARSEVVTDGDRRRLEIHAPQAPGDPPVPWVLTNWVGPRPVPAPTATRPDPRSAVPLAPVAWRVEKDHASSGQASSDADGVTLEYALAAGSRANQFVAVVTDLAEASEFDVLTFRGRAGKPMRVSVQLRFPPDDRRWVRSVYLDPDERRIDIPVGEMSSSEVSGGPMPAARTVRSLLFVVDLVNAKPGAEGAFTITDVGLSR
jgi:hypothetical protein